MKITVLVDNNTIIDRYFIAEPALSFYIEDGDKKILFDAGYSDAFLKNASAMGIDLLDLNYIILSHSHLDHTWGLDPLIRLYTHAALEGKRANRPELIAHPKIFLSRTLCKIGDIGTIISEERLSRHFDLKFSEKPAWVTDDIVFLGKIPRENDFEKVESIGEHIISGMSEKDYIEDDTSIVYKSQKGLVVITGCAHAGICNTIEYAKKVCDDETVLSVIGGFHLLKPDQGRMDETIKYFKKLNPKAIYPCHCTDFHSKCALSSLTDIREVGVGLNLEF